MFKASMLPNMIGVFFSIPRIEIRTSSEIFSCFQWTLNLRVMHHTHWRILTRLRHSRWTHSFNLNQKLIYHEVSTLYFKYSLFIVYSASFFRSSTHSPIGLIDLHSIWTLSPIFFMIGRSRDILSASAGFSTQTTAMTCWHNTKIIFSENWKGITTIIIKSLEKKRTCHILNELKICDEKDLAWDRLWLDGTTWRSTNMAHWYDLQLLCFKLQL